MRSPAVVTRGAYCAVIVTVAGAWIFGCGSTDHSDDVTDDNQDTTRNKRLIGGHTFNRGKWPWLISISGTFVKKSLFGVPISTDMSYCGGSLISKRWVLSAAHCFEKSAEAKTWEVTLGETNAKAWRPLCNFLGTLFGADNWKVWKVPVAKIIVHPDYNKQDTWHNDLAVLKLEYDVPATIAHIPRIRKVALPIQGDTSFPKVGQECYMKGWGCDTNGGPKQELAREVMLPIRSNVDCSRSIRRNLPWLTRLCAGYNGTLKGLCQGDSGGPLVCRRHHKWVQYGIASFSSAIKPGKVPGVFTRVSAYIDWIRLIMSSN